MAAGEKPQTSDGGGRFRRLVEMVDGIVPWEADPISGRYTYVGPQAEKLLGYPLEDWYEPGFWVEHVHPEDRLRWTELRTQSLSGAIESGLEYRMLASDGRSVWIRDIVSVVWADDGSKILQGFLSDVTDRKHAEEAALRDRDELEARVLEHTAELRTANERLQEQVAERLRVEQTLRDSEAPLHLMLEQLPAILWTTDSQLLRTSTVGAGLRSLGAEPNDNLGRHIAEDMGLKDMNSAPVKAHYKALKGVSSNYEIEFGGHTFHAHVEPLRDPQGRIIGTIGLGLDVTSNRQAQEALRQSELRYRTLAEVSAVGIWHVEPNSGETIYANPAMCQLLEIDYPEELAHESFHRFFTPEGLETIAVQHARRRAGIAGSYEVDLVGRRGRRRRVVISGAPLFCASGKLTSIIGTFIDITERKAAEEALLQSERRNKSILEAVPDLMLVLTSDGTFVDIRAKRAEDLVAPVHEMVGRNLREFVPPGLLELHNQNVARAIETGQIQTFEYTLSPPSGTTYFEARLAAVNENEVLALVRNITKRRRAEEALRESEDRFRSLIEDLNVGVLLQGPDAQVLLCNPAASELLGLTEAQLTGTHPFDAGGVVLREDGTPFPTLEQPVPQAIALRRPVRNVYMGVERPSRGDRIWLLVNAEPQLALDGSVKQVICTFNDVTDRKRAEEERRRLEAQIQHTQKLESLGVLAGGIAHDFNNLLMGILGNVGLALMELPSTTPARPYLEKIETVALHAAELTNQMLAYSGKGKFIIQQIDLSRLVRDMTHLLEMVISKKAVLELKLSPRLPLIEADATQLRQVVMNLVTNASEAIGERNGVITIETGVLESSDVGLGPDGDVERVAGPHVFVEVTDTGCGMDAATQARMFDPFFTTKFTGRGLGLAAVLGIVRGHHGTTRISSQQGVGTRFRVLFPSSRRLREELIEKAPPDRSVPRSDGGVVLVVDDEEVIRSLVRATLEKFGFTVLTASDGREACEIFRVRAADIGAVLLDMTMPRMSGDETFREMQQIRPEVRVILSSGYTEQEATARFAGHGLAAFIQKPYQPRDLLETLMRVLSS